MKTKIPSLLLLSLGMTTTGFGQGSLTPPGAPAPTMRSLDQIEPRVPISASTIIGGAGSYYLTKNIAVTSGHGIVISGNNVTLDLNGYTISSTESPANPNNCGIIINSGLANITIRNGTIGGSVTYSGGTYSGAGFGMGIGFGGGAPNNVRVEGVNVSGVLNNGIYLGFGSTTVESCRVGIAGGYGIWATSVSNSVALTTANSSIITNTAFNCTGSATGGDGIQASVAENCFGTSAGSGHGVHANTALNCYGKHTNTGSGDGLRAEETATNSWGDNQGGGGYGLYSLHTANSCYGSNSAGIGLEAVDEVTNSTGSGTSYGIFTFGIASNCNGSGNTGISCTIAQSCYGTTNGPGNYGIYASYSAMNSAGLGGSFGIHASIASFCTGSGNPTAIDVSSFMFGCSNISGVLSGREYFCGTGAFIYP